MGRPAAAGERERLAQRHAGAAAVRRGSGGQVGENAARRRVVDAVEAERFWAGLREHTDPFFNGIPPGYALWRLSLPSITEPMHLAGNQLMEWGGAQRWWTPMRRRCA
jgi:hypothetical protein